MACLASSPGRIRQTDVCISHDEKESRYTPREFCYQFGAFWDSMLGKFTMQDKADRCLYFLRWEGKVGKVLHTLRISLPIWCLLRWHAWHHNTGYGGCISHDEMVIFVFWVCGEVRCFSCNALEMSFMKELRMAIASLEIRTLLHTREFRYQFGAFWDGMLGEFTTGYVPQCSQISMVSAILTCCSQVMTCSGMLCFDCILAKGII